jgi:hypothetical protein
MAAARKDWVVHETGEALLVPGRNRSKVGVGNGAEGQRVAAGLIVVVNHR